MCLLPSGTRTSLHTSDDVPLPGGQTGVGSDSIETMRQVSSDRGPALKNGRGPLLQEGTR